MRLLSIHQFRLNKLACALASQGTSERWVIVFTKQVISYRTEPRRYDNGRTESSFEHSEYGRRLHLWVCGNSRASKCQQSDNRNLLGHRSESPCRFPRSSPFSCPSNGFQRS